MPVYQKMKRVHPQKEHLKGTTAPTLLDIAWGAGIFEGEGCVSCSGGIGNHRGFGLVVAQKDPEILHRMRELFGGSVVEREIGGRPCGIWAVYGARARGVAFTFFKLLSARRKSQVLKYLQLEGTK